VWSVESSGNNLRKNIINFFGFIFSLSCLHCPLNSTLNERSEEYERKRGGACGGVWAAVASYNRNQTQAPAAFGKHHGLRRGDGKPYAKRLYRYIRGYFL